MTGDAQAFRERARSLADRVRNAGSVAIFSHIDADGVSSAAIAYRAVERLGFTPKVHFLKSMSEKDIKLINSCPEELVWICDLGAGSYKQLDGSRCIITDHHHIFGSGQSFLEFFGGMENMLNPLEFGFEGSTHLSGAGCTYFVARELDPANADLAYLAIVGAVGDLQDKKARRLDGPLHASIIEDARSAGTLKVAENDLPFFGWVTRTAVAMIAFSNDLKAIGYECTFNDVNQLFKEQKVSTYRGRREPSIKDENLSKFYSWSELRKDDRNNIIDALKISLLKKGKDPVQLVNMMGDVYLFPRFPLGSASREAKEFATMLNASGRYLHSKSDAAPLEGLTEPQIAVEGEEASGGFQGELIIKACLDPVTFSSDAMAKLGNHRDNLKKGMEEIHSIVALDHIQYIKGRMDSLENKNRAKYTLNAEDTILGIIVGMVLDQKPRADESRFSVREDMPLIAMAEVSDDGDDLAGDGAVQGKRGSPGERIKVSGRMRRELAEKGVHLGEAMKQAALKVKGVGGGHNVAAGATVPKRKIKAFLEALDKEIGEQKARFSPSGRP
ncbi:MAG TPA: DHH family phosphoesterase [Methanomassiliicoccales archaeon]|nr:DHH family phosphoesterase [Methanomassiliicoccales archaeon]